MQIDWITVCAWLSMLILAATFYYLAWTFAAWLVAETFAPLLLVFFSG